VASDQLLILAFDHRGSFQKNWFGITGEPTPEDVDRIADGKEMIFEGLERAASSRGEADGLGGLVDEQFGAPRELPARIKAAGLTLAMPVERSGQPDFDFEYGEEFGDHIERFDPDFSKVLVRYNPSDDPATKSLQAERLARLSTWLRERDRKFLFELLVPGTDEQLESVGGDSDRYDKELRPGLMRDAIAELQSSGVEPHIWKIEGLDERADCEMLVAQCRADGRDDVTCVVLGRGADAERVEHWLQQAAPVDGYIGFAIGRSIWGDPLRGLIAGELERSAAIEAVANAFLHFAEVYESAR
jgi:myo-inositol catabolism protein IolC